MYYGFCAAVFCGGFDNYEFYPHLSVLLHSDLWNYISLPLKFDSTLKLSTAAHPQLVVYFL